jgi:hypothetical protein
VHGKPVAPAQEVRISFFIDRHSQSLELNSFCLPITQASVGSAAAPAAPDLSQNIAVPRSSRAEDQNRGPVCYIDVLLISSYFCTEMHCNVQKDLTPVTRRDFAIFQDQLLNTMTAAFKDLMSTNLPISSLPGVEGGHDGRNDVDASSFADTEDNVADFNDRRRSQRKLKTFAQRRPVEYTDFQVSRNAGFY